REFMATGKFPPTVTTTVRHPSGKLLSVEMGLGGTRIDKQLSVVAFFADTTQKKSALESLRRSEERFRSVVESIPEAIFVTDGTRLVYANPAFSAAFGPAGEGAEPSPDVLGFFHRLDAP